MLVPSFLPGKSPYESLRLKSMGELTSMEMEAANEKESTRRSPCTQLPRSQMFSAAVVGFIFLLFSTLAFLISTPATFPDALRKPPDKIKSLDKLVEGSTVDALELLDIHAVTTTESLCCQDAIECSCPNATVPEPVPESRVYYTDWRNFHDVLVQRAHQSGSSARLVLMGDSILEFLTGTAVGSPRGTAQAIYEKHFEQSTTVTLATGGDRTNNLLWRLNNDMFPDSLQPKVWFILIGTNNFAFGCSKEATLAGIVYIANYIHSRRPNSKIILHGLLPRSDDTQSYVLGQYWVDIQWINQQLQQECEQHTSWCTYMETPLLFLKWRQGN